MRPDRTLCESCAHHLAKKGRAFCSGCYRNGARVRVVTGMALPAKPAALVDTGLRIDDEFAELVHPDGTRQFPVPRQLIFTCWVEADADNPHLLRVLRCAPTKETA